MNQLSLRLRFHLSVCIVLGLFFFDSVAVAEQRPPHPAKRHHSRAVAGYLAHAAIPNSEVILPPPPGKDSAADVFDQEVSRQNLTLRGTPRWHLAARDAVLSFPKAAQTFACALDAHITAQETPHLLTLLQRVMMDAGFSTFRAKNRYKRLRPFTKNKMPICVPEEEKRLKHSGAYPSGHAAVGWAWALVLSELAPERADAILARGLAFGQSRVVCNVHWQSDVVNGRTMAAATVARLHTDAEFQADMVVARKELESLRKNGGHATGDCDTEARLLKMDAVSKPKKK